MKNRKALMPSIIKLVAFLSMASWISCKTETVKIETKQETMEISFDTLLTMDFVMGRFRPEDREDFALIDEKYASRKDMFLYDSAYSAFVSMWDKARKDGINLKILSASRNFDQQKNIWEKKWNGNTRLSDGTLANQIDNHIDRAKKILLYSSMPGTSRHHWGTDLDLNSLNPAYFEQGEGKKVYNWLLENASDFGYCQPYTSKLEGRTGYEEEKWHWSYRPVARRLLAFYIDNVSSEDITGFDGSHITRDLDVVKLYVKGIDSTCQP